MRDKTFIQERITAVQAQIVIYEDALTALGTAGIQSYKLDTGQTVQTVTRLDLKQLNDIVDSLYNKCATLEARLNGSGTINAGPCW